jgi:hypothetical protein
VPTTATPNLLQDPGFLFWAPLASTVPTMTVVGSKFTDAWPVAWINLGATSDGSEFHAETSVEEVRVAELLDPVRYKTTGRSGNFAFALADWTLANLKRVMNGGTLTVVSGTGATTLNKYTPPAAGAEVRCMIGWESLDSTVRIVAYQTLQGGDIASSFPAINSTDFATLAATFNFETPTSGVPWEAWTAGTARA